MFTPRECCRLMGFPDWYKVLGEKRSYHELGNAVCPPVVKSIVECMLKTGVIPEQAQGIANRSKPSRKKKRKLSEAAQNITQALVGTLSAMGETKPSKNGAKLKKR